MKGRTQEMKSGSQDLTQGPIFKGIVAFALPLLISNLLQQLYNSVDSAVVGTYSGGIALAAVGSTGSIINMFIGFFLGIATGTGVLYSMHFGAGDYPGLKKIADSAFIISALASVLITAVGVPLAPQIMSLMKTPDDVAAEAIPYLRIYLAGTIFNLIYNVGAGMIRAMGDSRRPLIYLFISGAANLVLDLLCVAVLGMGAAGAAVATVAAQVISAVLVVLRMMRLPNAECRFHPGRMKLDRVAAWDVIRISVPCGLQGSMFSISNLLVQFKVNGFGSVAMAGVAAYNKIDGFVYMPTQALGLAVTTYVGQNIGAGRYDRMKKGIRTCLLLAACMAICVSACAIIFFDTIIRIFTKDPSEIAYARQMMWFMAPFAWIFAISDNLGGTLRGAGAAMQVTIISAMCICVFRVVWLVVTLHFFNDIRFVFICYPISWFLNTGTIVVYYLKRSRMRKAMESAKKAELTQ